MSVQLDALSKALRDLPYTDMLKVADIVRVSLGRDGPPLHGVADALATVRPTLGDTTAEATAEEKYFRRALRRKRTVVITPQTGGWQVALPGSNAACASKDLRHAVNTLLDQLAMLEAMDAK